MELMISLAIFGILLGIAVPTINLTVNRQRLHATAREVLSVLRSARDAAVNEGVPRYVLLRAGPGGEPGSYQVYAYRGGAWVTDRNEVPFKGSVDLAGTTLPALSGAPTAGAQVPQHAAYFDSRGRYPSGHSGSYTMTFQPSTGDPIVLTLYPQTGQVTGL